MMGGPMVISLSDPELQIDFAATLIQLRDTLLQDALFATVKNLGSLVVPVFNKFLIIMQIIRIPLGR